MGARIRQGECRCQRRRLHKRRFRVREKAKVGNGVSSCEGEEFVLRNRLQRSGGIANKKI